MIELVDKDILKIIVTAFHKIKNLEEKLYLLSRDMED
jgi:hypothetical protein